MKHLVTALLLALVLPFALDAQVKISTVYDFPLLPGTPMDSVLNGLKSIRACAFDTDVDGNGKSEIAVTSYHGGGYVAIFEAAGNDSIQLVWVSPHFPDDAGRSHPRYVLFGDLDNDGKKEVIFTLHNRGIMIFEWDGVVGSNNYGTSPSQEIALPFLTSVANPIVEYMEVLDVDGDGENELVVAFNPDGTADDRYIVLSAVGDWSTNDPGFSSFQVEYSKTRAELAGWGLNSGSPQAMMTANVDGVGNREIFLHSFDRKTLVPMRVPSPNTYQISDTTNGKGFIRLGDLPNDAGLFGGLAHDIDGDGRQELYIPSFPTSGSITAGKIHMISYEPGQSTTEIDSTNVTTFDVSHLVGQAATFGYGYGDIDGNGKPNLYFTSSYPNNVITLEFQGGDKRNPANWVASVLYAGDPTIFADQLGSGGVFLGPAFIYRDSLGVGDTLRRRVDDSFPSKIHGRLTDFDNDGREDIILPYQALQDSFTVWDLTWNVSTSTYDTVVTRHVNPKRRSLRILEKDPSVGIRANEMTIITPDDYHLAQNYPNPFNPSTTISFYLPVRSRISLTVHDILGREVRTLISTEEYTAGTWEMVWDGKDNRGVPVSSGMYLYTLRFGNFEKTNRMMLVK
jgi:hypothetical protein